MQNDRPIENERIQHVLAEFSALCRYHDLVGCCVVIDEKESGFTYQIYSTWNAIVEDDTLPLGFRIRIKQDELGSERAHQVAEGTAWTFGALMDFGSQTKMWMGDLMGILRKSGMRIHHNPFGGRKFQHLIGIAPKK